MVVKRDITGFSIFLISALLPLSMATQELQAVVQGNSEFTKSLYNVLSQEPGNVFFSPISAHAVLSMAYQGSAGKTEQAFAQSLHLPDLQTTAIGYGNVISHLNNVQNVTLLMANKIYVADGHSLKVPFKDVVTKQFQSEVESVNFGDNVNTANNINSWVEQKTHDKIKNLIQPDSLDQLTRLVLVNAIYFKGKWQHEFDASRTKTEKFYLNNVDTIDVQMMNGKAKYNYKEDHGLDAKILELPYANDDFSLVIILPNKKDGITELEEKLKNIQLNSITENMHHVDVIVKLPKFKIESTIKLNEPLKKIGLGNIFGSEANFSNMLEGDEPLYVSEAIQKAFIEVNEEGTEAAAATGLGIALLSAPILRQEFNFHADHPFLVHLVNTMKIIDGTTQSANYKSFILFSGRNINPLVQKY